MVGRVDLEEGAEGGPDLVVVERRVGCDVVGGDDPQWAVGSGRRGEVEEEPRPYFDLLKELTNEERPILHDDVESTATSLARSSA